VIDPVLRIETGYTGLNTRSWWAMCLAVCIRGVFRPARPDDCRPRSHGKNLGWKRVK